MIYDYYCDKCKTTWEEAHTIELRDWPVGKPCNHCDEGTVLRGISAPQISYEGNVSAVKRAGSGWNDVLKGIKKASGKDNTIEHY